MANFQCKTTFKVVNLHRKHRKKVNSFLTNEEFKQYSTCKSFLTKRGHKFESRSDLTDYFHVVISYFLDMFMNVSLVTAVFIIQAESNTIITGCSSLKCNYENGFTVPRSGRNSVQIQNMKMALNLPRVAISHMTTPKDHLRRQKLNNRSGGIKLKDFLDLF